MFCVWCCCVSQLDHSDYHVDKAVTAAAAAAGCGTDVTVDVTFEPSSVGDTRAILTVSSTVGGDYTFPLSGLCSPPKPQVSTTSRILSLPCLAWLRYDMRRLKAILCKLCVLIWVTIFLCIESRHFPGESGLVSSTSVLFLRLNWKRTHGGKWP